MRTRSQDLEVQNYDEAYVGNLTTWKCNGYDTECILYQDIDTPVSFQVHSGQRITNDIEIPNFHRRRAAGGIFNNPYDSTLTISDVGYFRYDEFRKYRNTYNTTHYNRYYTNTVDRMSAILNFPALLALPVVDLENLKNIAITQAWSKVAASSGAMALVSVAEARKTVNLIAEIFVVALRYFRRGMTLRNMIANGLMTSTKAAHAWLQWRYGIRPLYYDIVNAIEAYNAIGNKQRVRLSSSISFDEDVDSLINHVVTPRTYSVRRWSRTNGIVSAGVLVEAIKPKIDFAQAFGTCDVLETTWELLPYSFVVDWFAKVGTWIAAWTPSADVRPLTSWVVVRKNDIQLREIIFMTSAHVTWTPYVSMQVPQITNVFSAPDVITKTTTERIPQPDLPFLPPIQVSLDWKRMIDLLALIKQLM